MAEVVRRATVSESSDTAFREGQTQASSTRTIITDIAEAADRSSTNESLKAAFVNEFLSRSDQNRKARTSNSL